MNAEQLRELVHYDPATGAFTRYRAGPGRIGGHGGLNSKGYMRMSLLHRLYACHRLAWLYVYGEWPNGHLDHINGVRSDNRIENLRVASMRLNAENQRQAMPTNKLGVLGVRRTTAKTVSRYAADICTNGKSRRIGTFGTPEEAHAAYVAAKRQLHEGCTL